MDDARFDGLARLLAKAGSRRAAVRAALGLAAGAVAGTTATEAGAKRRKGGPVAAGPCGSGKVKDNRCKRDSQCCTNICDRNLKNKDKKGRCRCRNRGQACTEDRNCCVRRGQQMVCLDGVCTEGGPSLIPTGEACVPDGVGCLDPEATCIEYIDFVGGPDGTYCLLQTSTACTAVGQCVGFCCSDGFCCLT